MTRHRVLALLLIAASAPSLVRAADRTSEAKALFFDRRYAAARDAWAAVQAQAGNDPAVYWVARCSELLGEHERALGEYGRYLEVRPADAVIAEEARTSRVSLAARLYKSGRKGHVRIVEDALEDPSRTVRYFAALQLAGLGREVGKPAVPVLRRIVAEERDRDLVERAKLALLRVDSRALSPASEASAARGVGPWIRVRIYEAGESVPDVSIDLPLALAELVFKGLPDETRRDLRGRGYEAESFIRQLREMGPARILDVKGDGGDRVQIWIE